MDWTFVSPPNVRVEIPTPNVMVLGGVFGWWLGHEGRAPTDRISALRKRPWALTMWPYAPHTGRRTAGRNHLVAPAQRPERGSDACGQPRNGRGSRSEVWSLRNACHLATVAMGQSKSGTVCVLRRTPPPRGLRKPALLARSPAGRTTSRLRAPPYAQALSAVSAGVCGGSLFSCHTPPLFTPTFFFPDDVQGAALIFSFRLLRDGVDLESHSSASLPSLCRTPSIRFRGLAAHRLRTAGVGLSTDCAKRIRLALEWDRSLGQWRPQCVLPLPDA